ncbi:MAG: hypothetical protein ACQCN5_09115 [Candidatus Bathyarchaeia archaeon]|jgi:DNA-directed RNA polymerase subunit RPC12/RpoP
MEPNRSILKLETTTETPAEAQQTSTNYLCIRCGKQFTKPIFAVNNSPGIAEAYYACPSCLSKVEIRKEEKTAQVQEEAAPEEAKTETPAKSVSEPPVTPSVCTHYAGYLKKRPKNTPVPEECFTCTLMLDCMSG